MSNIVSHIYFSTYNIYFMSFVYDFYQNVNKTQIEIVDKIFKHLPRYSSYYTVLHGYRYKTSEDLYVFILKLIKNKY